MISAPALWAAGFLAAGFLAAGFLGAAFLAVVISVSLVKNEVNEMRKYLYRSKTCGRKFLAPYS
jgi:hypothetical protein